MILLNVMELMLLIDLILNQITGQTGANETKEAKIMVPLKYLSNFLRILEMSFFLIVKLMLFSLGLQTVL